MTIQEPRSWPSHVAENPGLTRVLAHPGGEAIGAVPGDVSLAIGPEGGFTDTEVAMAQSAGWRVIGLGPRLLRVETAALALTACLTS
jgi:16S rRNA (uracil1498-N3)-methyltransferase